MFDSSLKSRVRRCSLARAIAVVAVGGTILLAAPGPAMAGECSGWWPKLCGNVHNHSGNVPVLITDRWGDRGQPSSWWTLFGGQDGPDVGVRDVDGFHVPSHCKFKLAGFRWIGPGWWKVRDGQNIQISTTSCR